MNFIQKTKQPLLEGCVPRSRTQILKEISGVFGTEKRRVSVGGFIRKMEQMEHYKKGAAVFHFEILWVSN